MTRELTCIICPRGCGLKVEIEDGKVVSVTGNSCPRGVKYAEDECCNPMRTITSTVRCEDGRVISVKTDRPIPKAKMFECMKMINSATAHLPIHIGDVIIEDVFGSNVVATENA
ncbi:MAG: DUF1667 domain-containing protein [Lachnospiraceae bacterium]|nr:DUF1667 domain-containing protein [Lachnospiraceae bacterium]